MGVYCRSRRSLVHYAFFASVRAHPARLPWGRWWHSLTIGMLCLPLGCVGVMDLQDEQRTSERRKRQHRKATESTEEHENKLPKKTTNQQDRIQKKQSVQKKNTRRERTEKNPPPTNLGRRKACTERKLLPKQQKTNSNK